MNIDPFAPVATTLEFRRGRRTHIDPTSYRPARLDDYDPVMSGSVEVNLLGGTFRVPAFRHDDGTIETAEVIVAQVLPSMASYLATLVLTPGSPEVVIFWSRPDEGAIETFGARLSVSDDDSVVRLPPKAKRSAPQELTVWRLNPSTPLYFLRAYHLFQDPALPDDCDEADTLETLINRHGAERILGCRRATLGSPRTVR